MKRNVLITGACGFIGSHLTEQCVELGFNVRAFDRYNPNNNWGWLEHSSFKNDIEVVLGDIRDYDSVNNAMKGCNTVFHLAALIGIPYSYISPLAYIRTNVEGAYNVLQSARALGVEHILITSTSETYGTAQRVPIDEDHPIIAQSPYAASKIGADQLAISYHRSFGLPVKIVRPFNVFGPRQSARAVIPSIISQLLDGKEKVRLGNLTPTRDFTFVKDTVSGFIEIDRSDGLLGKITNIGMNEEISISDLIKLIARIMGKQIEVETENTRKRPQSSEVERLMCNNSRLLEFTSWEPRYTLTTGLTETVDWMKNNIQSYKPHLYNV